MTPTLISLTVFACIMAGVWFGTILRSTLPHHHLSGDTRDVVRLGTGLIGTIAGLVLGLLIASANSSFETKNTQTNQMTANIILLDNILAQYGPESDESRGLLRQAVVTLADRIWSESEANFAGPETFGASIAAEAAYAKVMALTPASDVQHGLKNRAIQTSIEIARTRLLLFAQGDSAIPMPFLVVLVFWLTIIFASFSMFAHPNTVIMTSLVIFALCATSAIFLILELGHPFKGLMQISSFPLRNALAPL